jgi:hypothetical protein
MLSNQFFTLLSNGLGGFGIECVGAMSMETDEPLQPDNALAVNTQRMLPPPISGHCLDNLPSPSFRRSTFQKISELLRKSPRSSFFLAVIVLPAGLDLFDRIETEE